jgi:hypothetical protein
LDLPSHHALGRQKDADGDGAAYSDADIYEQSGDTAVTLLWSVKAV